MIEKIYKKLYNILIKQKEVSIMTLKPLSSQVSIFLSDGIMNPRKLLDDIANDFDKLFCKEEYILSLEDAPSDMPLIRFSSKDSKYTYDFAKKRINFYLNFMENDNVEIFEEYKCQIKNFITNSVLRYSNISRVGIALNYYVDKRDDNSNYWIKKYNLPLSTQSTSQVNYMINNNFINKGLKYNQIITLSNGKITQSKNVPIVSIDINNLPTAKLSDETLNYIFDEIKNYDIESLKEILNA